MPILLKVITYNTAPYQIVISQYEKMIKLDIIALSIYNIILDILELQMYNL